MELRSPSVWNNESSLFVFIMKHLFELLSSCSHIKKKTKTTTKTPKPKLRKGELYTKNSLIRLGLTSFSVDMIL